MCELSLKNVISCFCPLSLINSMLPYSVKNTYGLESGKRSSDTPDCPFMFISRC